VKTHTLAPVLQFVLSERGWPCPASLDRLARHLPAVATAGLELRLDGEPVVDLQQRIRSPLEVARLQRWIASVVATSGRSDPAWECVRRTCEIGFGVLGIEEVWLEFDDADHDGASPPLSMFVKLVEGTVTATGEGMHRVLDGVAAPSSDAQRAAMLRCITACGPGARVTHLGLMLGRPGTPVRLIIDGIGHGDIDGFLSRSGWPGSSAAAQHTANQLSVHVDRIRLTVTIADGLTEEVGFECFVGGSDVADPRWRGGLTQLTEMGVCLPSERDRLLTWPAALTPASVSGTWPESLIVEALARGGQRAGWIDCRISHVKVVLAASRPLSAKAYLGFVELWDGGPRAVPPPVPDSPPRSGGGGIDAAIERAINFLLAARTQSGWWLDYDGFTEGPSDEWVTAYVAHALCDVDHAAARAGAQRAWQLLAQRRRAGWGWNFVQPADADSTAWALRLAARLGALDEVPARTGLTFLRSHAQPDGGVSTYLPHMHHAWMGEDGVNPDWFQSHGCVTAAAAGLLHLGPGPFDYLRAVQRVDGAWTGYWWRKATYATAHAAEALAAAAAPDAVARAAAWADAWIDDGSPFDLALALKTIMLNPGGSRSRFTDGTERLLQAQWADGSWSGSAALGIPNRHGVTVPALDHRRTFTTATVLRTLVAMR
jgi:hypothetical protein